MKCTLHLCHDAPGNSWRMAETSPLGALCTGLVTLSGVDDVGGFLLEAIPMALIPAAVGLGRALFVPLSPTIFVSAVVVASIIVTGVFCSIIA